MIIKIKPVRSFHKRSTKPESGHHILSGLSYGSGNQISWGYWDTKTQNAVAFHYEKVKRKVKTSKRVRKEYNGKTVWTTKRTYESGYWIVSYYVIPIAVLKAANLKLWQKTRHFTLSK